MKTTMQKPCPLCGTAPMALQARHLFCTACNIYIGAPGTFEAAFAEISRRRRDVPYMRRNPEDSPEVRFFDAAMFACLVGMTAWAIIFFTL